MDMSVPERVLHAVSRVDVANNPSPTAQLVSCARLDSSRQTTAHANNVPSSRSLLPQAPASASLVDLV